MYLKKSKICAIILIAILNLEFEIKVEIDKSDYLKEVEVFWYARFDNINHVKCCVILINFYQERDGERGQSNGESERQ